MDLPRECILQQGKYKLKHVVGQGGFGITYYGVWFTEVKGSLGVITTEVPVCIKEYFFKDYCFRDKETNEVKVHSETGKLLFSKFKEKLLKEAKILSDVSHPYIVNVLEVFEENNTAYIVMEYIAGCSLKYMLDTQGILPENKILKYTRQIGEALQFIHANNILHLDIKPSNILIDKNDNAKLIDFGVSKRYDIQAQETSTTMLTLSKGFASIEQYDNEGTLHFSPCPDIYSLGATIYNLATAKIPTESILRATRPLIKPSELNPQISSKTEAAILKAMEIIPEKRFQSAKEMLDALDIPIEESLPENKLQEIHDAGEDETIVLPAIESKLIRTSFLEPENRVKKKKRLQISVFVVLALLIVSTVAFIIQSNSAQNRIAPIEENPQVVESPQDTESTILTDPESQEKETLPQHQITEPTVLEETKTGINNTEEETKEEDKVALSVPVTTQEDIQAIKTNEETNSSEASSIDNEADYIRLIASGKEKMNIFDFVGAKNDFTEAKTIRITEEVVRLLIACDAKEEEYKIAQRKEAYDIKMDFGNLKIVTNKQNNRYGAINDKAEEVIPCKYITVGRSENGRAFEREDHLFDIYNEKGELLGSGLTYY